MKQVKNTNHIVKNNFTGELFYQYKSNGRKVFLSSVEKAIRKEVKSREYWGNYSDVSRNGKL